MNAATPDPPDRQVEVGHRLRISQQDVHYGGGLVDGARVLQLFGDAATELMIRLDGDEGLLAAYERVEFLAPTHAGDFVEVRARLLAVGRRSRRIELSAERYIAPDAQGGSGGVLLTPSVSVCRATMVAVAPEPGDLASIEGRGDQMAAASPVRNPSAQP